jgi:hypothetical protein
MTVALPVRTIICVGSAPSSGSTLLADLLDSAPGVACGPELNVFCIDAAYGWGPEFKKAARARTAFPVRSALVASSRFFNTRHLDAVGLDERALDALIDRSSSLRDFVARFVTRYAEFRRRALDAFAEKMPSNVAYGPQFQREFPEGHFVVLVRDGRAVVASLRRRGFTLYEAALIWLWDVAAGEEGVTATNGVLVRYEDLVAAPFEQTAQILSRAHLEVEAQEVEAGFEANEYRAGLGRVESWRASTFAGGVRQGLGFDAELSETELAFLERLVLHRPGEEPLAFSDALRRYGHDPVAKGGLAAGDVERIIAEYVAMSENVERQAEFTLLVDGMGERQQRRLLSRRRRRR